MQEELDSIFKHICEECPGEYTEIPELMIRLKKYFAELDASESRNNNI